MRILLDTNILLWALIRPERLKPQTLAAITDGNNEILFSAVSIWEIAVKSALKKPDFTYRPEEIAREAVAATFTELPVFSDAAALVSDLPHYHRDPFDRLLVAQALAILAPLYTADAQLVRYTDLVKLVE